MERDVFKTFRDIVYEKSGIALGDNKDSLVSARVAKRMRALQITDHRAYLRYLDEDRNGEELVLLLDAISTNVTSFFRESTHFDFVRKVFGNWLTEGQTRFRIWSAACSTGQEPYTLAMTLQETIEEVGVRAPLDIKILATDISTSVLSKSIQGNYQENKMDQVANPLRFKYFDREQGPDGVCYTAKPILKKMILFKRFNLSKPPFPMHGPMDLIFCRNVMIYFDNELRRRLLEEMYRLLRADGFLMVGHAESLTGMVSSFKVVRPSIYTKPMKTLAR